MKMRPWHQRVRIGAMAAVMVLSVASDEGQQGGPAPGQAGDPPPTTAARQPEPAAPPAVLRVELERLSRPDAATDQEVGNAFSAISWYVPPPPPPPPKYVPPPPPTAPPLPFSYFGRYEEGGTQIIRHPARKDYTDLELALQHVQALGATHCLVFAGLGERWDQTLANLLLLASPRLKSTTIRLIEGHQEITLLQPGQPTTLAGQPGDTLSLIPLAGDAHGITTQGLEYPLHQETLHFGATRGVSNVLTGPEACIRFEQGSLLCTLIHHA